MQYRQRGRAGKSGYLRRRMNRWAGVLLLFCLLTGGLLNVRAARNAPEVASLKEAKSVQGLLFPLETTAWRVSDPYGWRKDPFTGQDTFHQGVDLACAEGTTVRAVLDGVVTMARRSATYGNYLRISHADGQETIYAHMQYLYVRAGEVVQAGQSLGTVGQTGRATGAHLHFELLEKGARRDPSAALQLP